MIRNYPYITACGANVRDIEIGINTALFDSKDKYLVIAESSGQNFCLISDKEYMWGESIEGTIMQVHVNENGYVAIIYSNTNYKSIIDLYSNQGKRVFRMYLSTTRIIDASISKDNKYIAYAELDTSGALVQSNIKIISVENAIKDSENAVAYTHNAKIGKMITNIEYQTNGQIACMYDDSIDIIENRENSEVVSTDKTKVAFMSIKLKNSVMYIEEESSMIFKTNSYVKILNKIKDKEYTYILEEAIKDVHTYQEVILLNAGTELYFIDETGWLIKQYKSKQEITNIVLTSNIAGIIYRDRIEIVKI